MAYIKNNWTNNTWSEGQTAMQTKLNHMETGIEEASGGGSSYTWVARNAIEKTSMEGTKYSVYEFDSLTEAGTYAAKWVRSSSNHVYDLGLITLDTNNGSHKIYGNTAIFEDSLNGVNGSIISACLAGEYSAEDKKFRLQIIATTLTVDSTTSLPSINYYRYNSLAEGEVNTMYFAKLNFTN